MYRLEKTKMYTYYQHDTRNRANINVNIPKSYKT